MTRQAARRHAARGDELTGLTLTMGAALGYGALPIVAKAGYASGLTVGQVVGLRSVLAGLLLGAVAILVERRNVLRALLDRRTLLLAALFAAHTVGFLEGVRHVGAAVTGLVFFCYPAVLAIMERLFYGSPLNRRMRMALALNLCGLLLLGGGALHLGLGILYVMLATLGYASYMMLAARGGQTASPMTSSAVTVLVGGALCMAVQGAGGTPPALPSGGGAWACFTGLILAMAVGVPCLLAGVARLGAVRAAVVSAAEPVVTVALAALLLGEALTPSMVVGGTLITLAATWAATASRDPVVGATAPDGVLAPES